MIESGNLQCENIRTSASGLASHVARLHQAVTHLSHTALPKVQAIWFQVIPGVGHPKYMQCTQGCATLRLVPSLSLFNKTSRKRLAASHALGRHITTAMTIIILY